MGIFLHWLKIEEKKDTFFQDTTIDIVTKELNQRQDVSENTWSNIKNDPVDPVVVEVINQETFELDIPIITPPTATTYDTVDNDTSIQKFVSPSTPFHDKKYVPDDLVSLDDEFIVDVKGTAQMRKEAAAKFWQLSEAFYEEFWKKIIVVSTYRSYMYQKRIKDNGCPDSLCSKAWHSEHQTGLAIDLWEASNYSQFLWNTKLEWYFEWMKDNASIYGFHNSYQKWLSIDGYEREPWHWRYVWIEYAEELKKNDMTFTEYNNL